MSQRYLRLFIFLLMLSLLVTGVLAAEEPVVNLVPAANTLVVGETTTVAVVMDSVPTGLSGFNITVALTKASVGEIICVTYPAWAELPENSSLPSDLVYAQAVDLKSLVGAGEAEMTLCTLTVRGDAVGETCLAVTASKIDDDVGGRYNPTAVSASIAVSSAPAPTTVLSFSPTAAAVMAGDTTEYAVVMAAAPTGLSGFNITVALSDPSVGEIIGVAYPAWAELPENSSIPSDSVYAQAVDLKSSVGSGTTNVTLCTLTVRGKVAGETNLTITALKIDDDVGGRYNPTAVSASIAVSSAPAPTTGLSFNPTGATVLAGDATEYVVVMAGAPTGLSGFNITVSLTDSSVGEIIGVAYPAWVEMSENSNLPADSVYAQAVDLKSTVGSGTTNVTLCTLTVRGKAAGETNLTISAMKIDDDVGGRYAPETTNAILYVEKLPPPLAAFSVNATTGTAPLTVQFTDTSSGEITDSLWKFGDGATAMTRNATHTYTEAGTYTVRLTVNGPGGDDTAERDITVRSPVVRTSFSANVTSGVFPLAVRFTDTSADNPASWLWSFGDGANSADQNPVHIYSAPGNYTVTLSINGGEYTCTKPKYIRVTPFLFGDATGDGVVNQVDTLRVLKEVVGMTPKPARGCGAFERTDVHRNGIIEVGDAMFIAQYNVGLRDPWFALIG